jgi:ring-1,2-phenylacetyl-CoA epoxidase subunit PaaE
LGSTYINQQIKAGDTLELLGPSGNFCVTPEPTASREYVLLAGGSGITPMMSIARTVLAREPESKLALLYGNRTWEDVIFAEAWTELCQQYPNRFNVRHILSSPPINWKGGVGRLDEATTRQELMKLAPSNATHFYVCGPEPMMKGVKDALIGLGVSADRIHEERFSSTAQKTTIDASVSEAPQPMTVQQAGTRIGEVLVPTGKTLLQAGLDARVPMSFSCGMGNCGECRVRLIRGEVRMAEPNCLSADERKQGFTLACVARPVTAITIEI